jgi:hypothetical protein
VIEEGLEARRRGRPELPPPPQGEYQRGIAGGDSTECGRADTGKQEKTLDPSSQWH